MERAKDAASGRTGARRHRRRGQHPGPAERARPLRHRSRQPDRPRAYRRSRCGRQQVRAAAERSVLRSAQRTHRPGRSRVRDSRSAARRPRNIRDHETARGHDVRRGRRIQRPHRVLPGRAQLTRRHQRVPVPSHPRADRVRQHPKRRDPGSEGKFRHPPHRRRPPGHRRSPRSAAADLEVCQGIRRRSRRALRPPHGHRPDARIHRPAARSGRGHHRRDQEHPQPTVPRDRQTVDVIAHRRPDRQHPMGGLQRGHRVHRPLRHRPRPW